MATRSRSTNAERTLRNISYVQCRTLGHAWEKIPRTQRTKEWVGYGFALRCTRCHTERYDDFDHVGELSRRQYGYPDDYKLAKDETPDRSSLRMMFARVERLRYRDE